ncbi:MAG: hypothetical protein PVI89_06095, partial [Desulfobacteraceae bacterium]
ADSLCPISHLRFFSSGNDKHYHRKQAKNNQNRHDAMLSAYPFPFLPVKPQGVDYIFFFLHSLR